MAGTRRVFSAGASGTGSPFLVAAGFIMATEQMETINLGRTKCKNRNPRTISHLAALKVGRLYQSLFTKL